MTRPVQILLVDDEVSIQRAMAPLLRSRGYLVTVAGSGHEALDLFERERPDLVIVDLGLPDMDGTEVCRQIRERADTPILILSARGAEKDKVTALDQGADDYVTKPFAPEELMARVRAALRRFDDRLRSPPRAPGGARDQTHAEGIRAPDVARHSCRPGLDTSNDSEGDLVVSRLRTAGTPPRVDGTAAKENRTGPCKSALPLDGTVGRVSFRRRARLTIAARLCCHVERVTKHLPSSFGALS